MNQSKTTFELCDLAQIFLNLFLSRNVDIPVRP